MSSTTTPQQAVQPVQAPTVPASFWSQMQSGCCPPSPPDCFSGMARLMQCYQDVKLAAQFLSKIMTDLMQHDPTVQQAIVDAVQASGSSLPIIGVTNGEPAQPGQVGEYVQQQVAMNATGAANQVFNPPGIILQPGDWDMQANLLGDGWPTGARMSIQPVSAGISNDMFAITGVAPTQTGTGEGFLTLTSPRARGLFSVPTLIPFSITYNILGAGTPGDVIFTLSARRMR